jgi:hypothetical protein
MRPALMTIWSMSRLASVKLLARRSMLMVDPSVLARSAMPGNDRQQIINRHLFSVALSLMPVAPCLRQRFPTY